MGRKAPGAGTRRPGTPRRARDRLGRDRKKLSAKIKVKVTGSTGLKGSASATVKLR